MSDAEPPKDNIKTPLPIDTFFDKDHIVFYSDDSGEIQCKYSLYDSEIFQDLLLTVLSGSVNDGILDFIIGDLNKQDLKEDALLLLMVKKLLKTEDSNPIVKPSNFR
jgi:hypothetical protein